MTERYGYEIEVADVGGTYVGILDGDEVLTRATRIAALAATESLAKRRYRAANPIEGKTEIPFAEVDDIIAKLKEN